MRFSDYSQEDSQEFLTFLLDGLHTELNVAKSVTESSALVHTVENPDHKVICIYRTSSKNSALLIIRHPLPNNRK